MEYFVWDVDPNLFSSEMIQIRWYGLMFALAFMSGFMLMRWIYIREKKNVEELDTLLIYVMLGAVIGSRLGHCLFYDPGYYLSNPLEILFVWKGGLASHGGAIGVITALFIYAKRYNQSYMWLLSRMVMPGTLAAVSVRIGNFFNSEILGIPTTVPWAVVFSRVDSAPRHPSQLYEALAYLAILCLLIMVYRKISSEFATKILPGIFLVTLFTTRFFIEFTKTEQASYTSGLDITTGQLLSIPYVLVGIVWIIWALKSKTNKQGNS